MAQRVEIPGSARVADPQHERVGEVDQDKPIEVTVYLRPSGSLDWVDQQAGRPPSERRTMSREELASAAGASDEDIAAVRSFAGEHGLELTGVEKGRRAVSLSGTIQAVADVFGVQGLQLFHGGHVPRPERTAHGSERSRGRDHRRVRDRRTAAGAGPICGTRSKRALSRTRHPRSRPRTTSPPGSTDRGRRQRSSSWAGGSARPISMRTSRASA